MSKGIEKNREEIYENYIGKYGIHNVSVIGESLTICIHVDEDKDLDDSVVTELCHCVGIYGLAILREPRPRLV